MMCTVCNACISMCNVPYRSIDDPMLSNEHMCFTCLDGLLTMFPLRPRLFVHREQHGKSVQHRRINWRKES